MTISDRFPNSRRTSTLSEIAFFGGGLLCTLLAIYIFFGNLDSPSIQSSDEYIHTEVVKNMIETGNVLQPEFRGGPYLGKPTFKLFLSTFPVRIFGTSNWSFRVLDALCGLATLWVTYVLGMEFLRSRWLSLLSCALLLGASHFIFIHSFRFGVQDGMLILLHQVMLLCSWRAIKRGIWFYWFLAATAAGLAILTKSAAGVFGWMIVGGYIVWCREWRLLRRVIVGSLITVALAAIYYLPLVLEPHGLDFLYTDLVARFFTKGLHLRDQPWLYMENLFLRDQLIARVPLLGGLLLASILAFRGDKEQRFLFVSFFVPLLFLCALKSRNPWYIYPIVPIGAIIAAGTFKWLLAFKLPMGRVLRWGMVAFLFIPFFTVSMWAIGIKMYESVLRVGKLKKHSAELLVNALPADAKLGFVVGTKWKTEEAQFLELFSRSEHHYFLRRDFEVYPIDAVLEKSPPTNMPPVFIVPSEFEKQVAHFTLPRACGIILGQRDQVRGLKKSFVVYSYHQDGSFLQGIPNIVGPKSIQDCYALATRVVLGLV